MDFTRFALEGGNLKPKIYKVQVHGIPDNLAMFTLQAVKCNFQGSTWHRYLSIAVFNMVLHLSAGNIFVHTLLVGPNCIIFLKIIQTKQKPTQTCWLTEIKLLGLFLLSFLYTVPRYEEISSLLHANFGICAHMNHSNIC